MENPLMFGTRAVVAIRVIVPPSRQPQQQHSQLVSSSQFNYRILWALFDSFSFSFFVD